MPAPDWSSGDPHRLAAVAALAAWDGDAGSLAHIANSGNRVYRFRRPGDPSLIPRLTGVNLAGRP